MKKNIIVIGASAGGVETLKTLLRGLSADLDAAIFIVLHVGASSQSQLSQVLQKECVLPVTEARDGELVRTGRVFVARPDYHLVVEADAVRLTRGPRENRVRPSVDALFRSAAYVYGPRVVGVILSGALDDGSAGLWWIKHRGGTCIVQDPRDALFPSMPENAIAQVQTDHVVSVREMPALFTTIAREEAEGTSADAPKELQIETKIAKEVNALSAGVMELGSASPYTCPECHGVLVQLKGTTVPQFRCHTGHAYSINTLLSDVTEYVERSLWNSMRAIEESAMLLRHMARYLRDQRRDPRAASMFDQTAADTLRRSQVVREMAYQYQTLGDDNAADSDDGGR